MKFQGTVVQGVQVGAKFGIATANLEMKNISSDLEEGVYFVWVTIEEVSHNGLLHYGPRKTFGADRTAEIHLLDFEKDLYGKELEVEILERERDIEQFRNADALFTQVEKDITRARKFFLRREIADQWKALSDKQKDELAEEALKRIENNETFQNAQNVYVYAPLEDEIKFVQKACTRQACSHEYGGSGVGSAYNTKTFCFPRIADGAMTFHASKWEDLKKGSFGILEPSPSSNTPAPDLVIVPSVAIDSQFKRLGRGGGFYDQFLSTYKGNTMAVIPSFALVEELPSQSHDQEVGEVIVV